jgi:hypothetical protein
LARALKDGYLQALCFEILVINCFFTHHTFAIGWELLLAFFTLVSWRLGYGDKKDTRKCKQEQRSTK